MSSFTVLVFTSYKIAPIGAAAFCISFILFCLRINDLSVAHHLFLKMGLSAGAQAI